MSVRRWNVYEVGGGGYFRIEWRDEPNGGYVSATDYDALTARVAELEDWQRRAQQVLPLIQRHSGSELAEHVGALLRQCTEFADGAKHE